MESQFVDVSKKNGETAQTGTVGVAGGGEAVAFFLTAVCGWAPLARPLAARRPSVTLRTPASGTNPKVASCRRLLGLHRVKVENTHVIHSQFYPSKLKRIIQLGHRSVQSSVVSPDWSSGTISRPMTKLLVSPTCVIRKKKITPWKIQRPDCCLYLHVGFCVYLHPTPQPPATFSYI